MSSDHALIVRNRKISEDVHGLISLDDIWVASKEKETRSPTKWRRTTAAKRLIQELQKNITNTAIKTNSPLTPVIYAKPGRGNKGTFAHPVLAAAYAGYLSAKLEIEVRTIWLRYRSGDAELADEILQRASKEANLWAGVRALARSGRNSYTGVLKDHGVQGKGYMHCTESVYLALLDGKSWQIRSRRDIPARVNVRDHLDTSELSFVMATESLAAERIEEEDSQGNEECRIASLKSARYIREAIERDRMDRQQRLI